jgi:hypothetical protein
VLGKLGEKVAAEVGKQLAGELVAGMGKSWKRQSIGGRAVWYLVLAHLRPEKTL